MRAEALIAETLKLEETRFRKTLGARPCRSSMRRLAGSRSGDRLTGETAFTLYDTLRLSARSHAGCAACRAASRSTPTRFNAAMERQRDKARASWAGSGEAATESVWFALTRQSRRHRIPGLRDRERRGRDRGAGQGRQGGRRRSASRRERRGHRQPDAVLRRIRRPGRRHRRHDRPTACASRVTDTQKKAGDLFVHSGTVEEGTLKAGDALALEVDHARRSAIRAQPFRDPSAARGAAPGARRSRRAEGLAGRARPAAL